MLSCRRLLRSFRYARHGLWRVIKEEQNFAIELIVGLSALILAAILQFSLWEWAVLMLVIGFVLVAELLNSAVERVSDLLKPRLDIYVKEIKDIMAATVFVAAGLSVFVGLILFLPHLIEKLITIFQ
ncbi:diacylglycerol kinase family protein [Candidatus Falkowbacteria bacterium]|nr:diacylglycerol kinase family protein [Candidatus Falkowbacteria bacterium]